MWRFLREAGIERSREVVTWNVIPWYVGDGDRIRSVTTQDIHEAEPALVELLGLLPELRVVVLLGRQAERAWRVAGIDNDLPVLTAPHPSPRNVNGRPEARQRIVDALKAARLTACDDIA
jgi:uracil-DNA glycosylase